MVIRIIRSKLYGKDGRPTSLRVEEEVEMDEDAVGPTFLKD